MLDKLKVIHQSVKKLLFWKNLKTEKKLQLVLLLYLFLALLFAWVYYENPASFNVCSKISFPQAIYFSFVTITTLGYGDISPVNNLGYFLVCLQALAGLLTLGYAINFLSILQQEKLAKSFFQHEYERINEEIFIILKRISKYFEIILENPSSYVVDIDRQEFFHESDIETLFLGEQIDQILILDNITADIAETCKQEIVILSYLSSTAQRDSTRLTPVKKILYAELDVNVKYCRALYLDNSMISSDEFLSNLKKIALSFEKIINDNS